MHIKLLSLFLIISITSLYGMESDCAGSYGQVESDGEQHVQLIFDESSSSDESIEMPSCNAQVCNECGKFLSETCLCDDVQHMGRNRLSLMRKIKMLKKNHSRTCLVL